MPEPATRSFTVLETSTSPGCALRGDAGADVDGDPADLAVDQLALAGVQAGADLEAELAHRLGDRAGAADRPGRAVEGGEEAVAGGVDLLAAEPDQLAPDERVVALEQVAPAPVAELAPRARSSRRCR